MEQALFQKQLKNKLVQCQLCPNFCTLKPDQTGKCSARKNVGGKLYSLNYGKLAAMNVDPIEKKPLFHFLPGSKSFSIATAGCNLHCSWCQNWQISQREPANEPEVSPQRVVDAAIKAGCESISYTYTEPTIAYEFVLETARLAHKRGLKNVFVSNGYINPAPLKKLVRCLDAANVDLKSMSESVYQRYCRARLAPVLDAIKMLAESGTWLEITNLLIPGVNDKSSQIKELAEWVKSNCGDSVPLHFSAFYPSYKMLDKSPTPAKTVLHARALALQAGLKYVYCGNIPDTESSDTLCPKCGKAVVQRRHFAISAEGLKSGKCAFCKKRVSGCWE